MLDLLRVSVLCMYVNNRRRRSSQSSERFCFLTAGIDCYMPANGETATVTTNPSVPVDISLNLLKREMALGGRFFADGFETLGICCLVHTLRRNEGAQMSCW